MALTSILDQPPTIQELTRRAYDLPLGHAAFVLWWLTAPGVMAEVLLLVADAADDAAKERGGLVRGDAEERAWRDTAALLRDAANSGRFPNPPRVPLNAEEADRSIHRRAAAAGITTASRVPGR